MTETTASGISLKYIPQVFAGAMTGVNRKDFPAQGSGTASFKEGIPSIYSVAPSAGGKYVERADINGIGWLATQLQYLLQVGKVVTFDQEFCNTINGYPLGAVLQMECKKTTKGSGDEAVDSYQSCLLMSLANNNTTDFNDEANASCIVDTPYDPDNSSISYINASYHEDGVDKFRWLRLTASVADVSSLKESDAEIIKAMNAKDTELEEAIASVKTIASQAYRYKGTLGKAEELKDVADPEQGDVYNISDTGDNYAYVKDPGEAKLLYGHWDTLGKMFNLEEVKSELKCYTDKAEENCTKYTDEAKAEAKTYTDSEISENCVLKSNVKGESTTEGVNDSDVYSVAYLNTKFADIAKSSSADKEGLEENITSAKEAAEAAQSAADGAQSTADEAKEAAETNLETAKSYTDEKVKALADGDVKSAKEAAEAAQSAADDAANDAQSALDDLNADIETSIIAKVLDRLSALESKVETLENWIKEHSSTSSTAEG